MNLHKQNAKYSLIELTCGLSPEEAIEALKAIITEAKNCIESYETNLDNQLHK